MKKLLLALIILSCLPAGGCLPSPAGLQTATSPAAVTIVGLFPLSGSLAELGAENKNGLQLAVDEINAAGGIRALGGVQIELAWGDTESQPDRGVAELERLAANPRALAAVGAYQSSVTMPASQVAERLGLPFVVNMAVADKITERGFTYVFRLCSKASWYARQQVAFILDLPRLGGPVLRRVVLLHEDSDYGESTAAGQKKYLAEAGLELAGEVKYPANAVDLSAELVRVAAARPDIVLTATYLQDAILIAQGRQAAGLGQVPFLDAAGGVVAPDFIHTVGPAAEGWLTESEFSVSGPASAGLADRYRARFQAQITGNAALAYQAGWVLADALERAGTPRRDALREALAKTDLPPGAHMILPVDHLQFDSHGQIPTAPLFITQVQDGALAPVWPPAYASASPRFSK